MATAITTKGPPADNTPALPVLVFNCGSSSLKFGLYAVSQSRDDVLLQGEAQFGDHRGTFHARDARHNILAEETLSVSRPGSQTEAMVRIARLLVECDVPTPVAIGHRIVHGGPVLRQHCVINETVLAQLEAATAFAPIHVPPALSLIHFAQERFPGLPQVACFDTTFHAALPDVARILPIARALEADGIQRYGFHGLSCESIVHQLAHALPDRLIIAHLGNGASVTAVKGGTSIDTSMGMTPTGGVMMGTRSGDLDPGVLVYLAREKQYGAAALEDLVDRRSGLLGISGVSSDMRQLREVAASNADARLAIDMFCYSVRKQVAAMAAALGGADMLVFTGGIGENDVDVRTTICSGLSWMGVRSDAGNNQSGKQAGGDVNSGCVVRVVASQENERIARHTWTFATRSDVGS